MQVKDIMTSDPACASPSDTVRDVARLMQEHDCGLIPVVEDTNTRFLIGVVTDRDLAVRGLAQGKGPDTLVRDVMSDGPDAVTVDENIERVQEIMTRRQVRRVPVIDERGGVIGIVAQADLARQDKAMSDREVGRVVERISEPRK